MKCLVLAAGMSSRLGLNTPKPLVPVASKPVIERNLTWLASQGITEVFINLHFQKEMMRAFVGNGIEFGVKVTWIEEDVLLGTAGIAKRIQEESHDKTERFLIVYGDNVINFNLSQMMEQHIAMKPLMTIATFDIYNFNTGIYGGHVEVGEAFRITRFVEGKNIPGRTNAGVYICEPEVFRYILPPPMFSDWGKHVFPELLENSCRLQSYGISGYCLAIDTQEALKKANQIMRMIERHDRHENSF